MMPHILKKKFWGWIFSLITLTETWNRNHLRYGNNRCPYYAPKMCQMNLTSNTSKMTLHLQFKVMTINIYYFNIYNLHLILVKPLLHLIIHLNGRTLGFVDVSYRHRIIGLFTNDLHPFLYSLILQRTENFENFEKFMLC